MPLDSKTILIVDDDLDTLNVIKLKLEGHGFQVVTAQDGNQALHCVRETPPDLVILDVMMPKLSGFKVARLIKYDAKTKRVPLILLTARTQEADRATGLSVGADLYVTKPFDPEKLLNEVKRLLGQ